MRIFKVAFFCDAGSKIGMGHLVRCYTLMQEFSRQGFETSFFLKSDINFSNRFKQINYRNWHSESINYEFDIAVIDSYIAGIEIYKKISEQSSIAIYIDDYERMDYPKGLIVNFSPEAKTKFFHTRQSKHKYLLGLNYLPIRESVLSARIERNKQIIIMSGGLDFYRRSEAIVEQLECFSHKKILVLNDLEINNRISKNFPNIEILFQPDDKSLVSKMASSSLAIATASMTTYELAYLKVPTMVYSVSHNQNIGLEQFIENKLAVGSISFDKQDWASELQNLVRKYQSKKIDTKIDGNGAKNIVSRVSAIIQ